MGFAVLYFKEYMIGMTFDAYYTLLVRLLRINDWTSLFLSILCNVWYVLAVFDILLFCLYFDLPFERILRNQISIFLIFISALLLASVTYSPGSTKWDFMSHISQPLTFSSIGINPRLHRHKPPIWTSWAAGLLDRSPFTTALICCRWK